MSTVPPLRRIDAGGQRAVTTAARAITNRCSRTLTPGAAWSPGAGSGSSKVRVGSAIGFVVTPHAYLQATSP